jgi:hypothetical protein
MEDRSGKMSAALLGFPSSPSATSSHKALGPRLGEQLGTTSQGACRYSRMNSSQSYPKTFPGVCPKWILN